VPQRNALALIVAFGEDTLASLWQSAVVLVGLNLALIWLSRCDYCCSIVAPNANEQALCGILKRGE